MMHKLTLPFVAGALLLGTACSTSNTGTDTTGATTGGSTVTTETAAGTGTPASGVNTGVDAGTTRGGTSNPGGGGVATGTTAPATTEATAMVGTSGADAAADMTAFMGTFATMDDPTFMLTAASSNMLETQLGQAASQRAANADVKKYAQMMVTHHTKATQDWKSVATPLGIQMPSTLMPVHQAIADKVMSKSGKEFDEAYMDAMETAHKMDVAMFEVKSGAAQTPAVKTFATKTLPMLRSHEKMANEIEKKVD